jgi:hypothetical protein
VLVVRSNKWQKEYNLLKMVHSVSKMVHNLAEMVQNTSKMAKKPFGKNYLVKSGFNKGTIKMEV